ncbi:MAG TPA: HupE/UreJ family protein [Kofleriaceae bacterium]|nr:HupE/UreJ family protein [Kofleriaceae bacterium]
MTRAVIVLALVLASTGVAAAHQSSVTHVEATLADRAVTVSVRIEPRDLAEAVRGDHDVALDPLAEPARTAAIRYVTGGLLIEDGAAPCPAGDATIATRDDRVEVRFVATCAAAPRQLVIDYGLLFEIDRNHTAVLRVRVPDATPADTLLDAEHARFVWDLDDAAPSGALAFVREGVHHVVTGLDHVAFVLALLLALVLERRAGAWSVRRLGPALRATAAVVTAFTLAHSLTLILAALGWVSLPVQLVESMIAASIVWCAVEDVIRPDVRWRFAVAFGFGLMHGLGFARMLADLLPPGDVVVPLVCFNLGVELAQLTIVAVVLPAVWFLAGSIGAGRYRRIGLPVLAGPLALVGAIWLIERVCGVTLLGL